MEIDTLRILPRALATLPMSIGPTQADLIIVRQNTTLGRERYMDHGTAIVFVLRSPFGAPDATRLVTCCDYAISTMTLDGGAVRTPLASVVPRSGE